MIRKQDLVDIGDTDWPQRQKEYIKCQNCGNRIGGTRRGYFTVSMDHTFVCLSCGSDNIAIVEDVITQRIVLQ